MNKIKLIGFFLILALPLLAIPPLFSPPEWGKAIAFRIIFSSILFLFLWQIISNPKFLQQLAERYNSHKKALWMLFAVFLTVLLSTLFSSDIVFSLWTSPHRSGGSINFTFYILFSVILFLILKNKDWKKLWDFSFLIGDLVIAFAILQYFNVFPKFLVSYEGRPPSTLSNSILLATYLIFLIFPVLSSIIKEKSKKRFFYLLSLLLYIFGILISGSRAAYLGLLVGSFYFFFFYPVRKTEVYKGAYLKKLPILKIITVILLIFAIYSVYYVNTHSEFPQILKENKIFQAIAPRLSIDLFLIDPRFSAWKVAFQALREKPILGWGPENFSIGFDKYYDPSLPYITKEWGDWWDRAHNIFLDLSVTYGLLFTIIYFSFFGLLFWKLQKNKRADTENKISSHAIQTTFVGYFTTLLFGFDSVTTSLLLFFIIGYCLYLTSETSKTTISVVKGKIPQKWFFAHKIRKFIILFLFIILVLFLWKYNIKPLTINAQIGDARNLVDAQSCEKNLKRLENLFAKKSFLDAYLRLKYAEEVKTCAEISPSKEIEYIKKSMEALKYASRIRPSYTRTWLLLGSFSNVLLANETNPKSKENLLKEINYYFGKALALSPKHQEILSEWAKGYFVAEDYINMKEKAKECVGLNPNIDSCYWYLGLSEILLGNEKKGQEYLQVAKEKRFPYDSRASYSQLAIVYTKTQNYKELAFVYNSLILFDPQNIQYHATLAFVYKELGDYKKAREEALKILEIAPEAKDDVNEFLKTLPY